MTTILDMWDFDDSGASQRRFEEAASTSSGDERLELLTQVGRALGLQGRFDEAHAVLDEVERSLDEAGARVRVRYLLERGRVRNSSGMPAAAAPLFNDAWLAAREAGLDGLAVDAAHMMAIVESGEAEDDWHREAMALAESSDDPDARRWRGSLLNNMGWTHHGRGELDQALVCFRRALSARLEQGKKREIDIAAWCVARCLRSLGSLDEALAMQREIYDEDADVGYGAEEIAECLLAMGKGEEARAWFGLAHRKLKDVLTGEPERVARLGELGG